jgi:polar amino acid transport system substrate-binding protein
VGYFYGKDFQQAEDNGLINVVRAASDIRNFKKLLSGEIDLFVSNEYVGWFILQQEFPSEIISKITYHPKTTRSDTYHLLMSKANPRNEKIINNFNKGLAVLKNAL